MRLSAGDERAKALWIASTGIAALIVVELLQILRLNGGFFTYSLDDPYIHLALASHIAHGHYGLNSGEFSSPSSSILWPFLLAPFANLRDGVYAPLFLNIVFALASLIPMQSILRRCKLPWLQGEQPLLEAFTLVLICLMINVVGLIFTGMEHMLQVLLTLVAIDGVVRCAEKEPVPWWVWVALFLGPLVRYENIAVTGVCALFFAVSGYVKQAGVSTALSLATVAAFSRFLVSLGLGPLPNSVMAKSVHLGEHGPNMSALRLLLRNVHGTVASNVSQNPMIIAGLALLIAFVIIVGYRGHKGIIAMILAVAIAQTTFAGYGWFERYHQYLVAFCLLLGLYVIREVWARDARRSKSMLAAPVVLLAFVFCCRASYVAQMTTPGACNNIFSQQYQMHRFLRGFYPYNVACNDVGYVSYKTGVFVVDLWGLGSSEALHARLANLPPTWMAAVADSHAARAVIVYKHWYPSLPATWTEVAHMRLGGPRVSVAGDTVSFFASEPKYIPGLLTALHSFAGTLPKGVTLELVGGNKGRA